MIKHLKMMKMLLVITLIWIWNVYF